MPDHRGFRSALAVMCLAWAGAGCTALDDFLASIPFLNAMRESPAIDPYEMPRPPAPGAVPFASPLGEPALPPVQPTEASLNAFAARVTNPLAGVADSVTQARGRVLYDRYCAVCHGVQGDGRGPIIGPGKFPFAPDLRLPASVQRSDGYLYGVIRVGRGLMPAYGSQTTDRDRWLIINHVRSLQQGGTGQPQGAAAPATPPQDTQGVR